MSQREPRGELICGILLVRKLLILLRKLLKRTERTREQNLIVYFEIFLYLSRTENHRFSWFSRKFLFKINDLWTLLKNRTGSLNNFLVLIIAQWSIT